MRIAVHSLVKNESRFVWFSVMSIIEHVDRILLWDTGSTDGTVEILEEIKKRYPEKVDLKIVGDVDIHKFTDVRQQMLMETKEDWFIIVDGDEVWWDEHIKAFVDIIRRRGAVLETIISPYYNLVGDIYHYQKESSGRYKIDNFYGHVSIRAIKRSIPGLHFAKPHGTQGLFDGSGVLVQSRSIKNRIYAKGRYLHFTNVRRSTAKVKDFEVPKRGAKFKYELGVSFPRDFYYPEIFFRERPSIVELPWEARSRKYWLISLGLVLPKRIKNLVSKKKVGY